MSLGADEWRTLNQLIQKVHHLEDRMAKVESLISGLMEGAP